jgi:ubiquinone biosynthesis protein UbiJ
MNTEDVNVGFIAQDVLDAIPEAVGTMKTSDTEKDDAENPGKKIKHTKREAAEFLTLSDRPIIAALVNAVKELNAKNEELEARITKLETKK